MKSPFVAAGIGGSIATGIDRAIGAGIGRGVAAGIVRFVAAGIGGSIATGIGRAIAAGIGRMIAAGIARTITAGIGGSIATGIGRTIATNISRVIAAGIDRAITPNINTIKSSRAKLSGAPHKCVAVLQSIIRSLTLPDMQNLCLVSLYLGSVNIHNDLAIKDDPLRIIAPISKITITFTEKKSVQAIATFR